MDAINLATDDYNRKITKLLGLFHTQDKNAQRFQVGVTPEEVGSLLWTSQRQN